MKRAPLALLLLVLAACGSPELVTRTEPTPASCPPVGLRYPTSDDSTGTPLVPGCPTGYVPVIPTSRPAVTTSATTSATPTSVAPTTTVTTSPSTSSASPAQRDVPAVYANCREVQAAGAAPIHRGEPGFRQKFDSDGDGVGCE